MFCNESGAFAEWTSDEIGFRNPEGLLGNKVDFLFLGDSFVEGACESEEDTFAGLFRLNGKSVYNLGRGGAGPLMNLATLVEYGGAVQARTVIWFVFTGNDLQNLREEKTTTLKNYLKDGYRQDLFEQRGDVGRRLRSFLNGQISLNQDRISRSTDIPRNTGYGETLDALEAQNNERFLLLEVLGQVNKVAKTQNAKLAIVLLNHPRPSYDFAIQDIVAETVITYADDNDIPVINFRRNYLERNKTQFYTVLGPHLSAEGYSVIGSQIFNWLKAGATSRTVEN